MRPAARIEAAIEIIDAIEEGIAKQGLPADAVFSGYCRKRRYIGSKDRRAISGMVYGVVRSRAKQLWRLDVVGLPVSGRSLVISYLAETEPESISAFGAEGDHVPDELSPAEEAAVNGELSTLSNDAMPELVRLELPEWLEESFNARFADSFAEAVSALNINAPFDVRSNPITISHDVIDDIKEIVEDIVKHKYSPIGFRSYIKNNIQDSPLYRNGLIEVQDEAAQLACYLVDAQPGMSVADLCAGAGGKSLLMAALMENKGKIQAFDISGKRLRELEKRAARSLCKIVNAQALPVNGQVRDDALSKLGGNMDRVVVDAPCSGTGTWRRNPDQRWRLSSEKIAEFAAVQHDLLVEGARMVKKHGRIVYMTCSILEAENEAVVNAFMDTQNGKWQVKPYADIWTDTLEAPVPETLSSDPRFLQLAPHMHQTDGFFVAILEKI
ncbi:RsmB/NOP family class I SAM-dependent RNA methyltransferase [Kordiimonas aquimaris]|uniref:RsmB/NOP family class I SAM-dependent RNA methyltransferase n=1 Tax=Kordiimonas aquimaris TaxID=707591 RepID=UPI0021CEC76A|nr:RsmB/NOP family class I SAM-dependent RNA methyltransferase [Kordiimonas aquimaris]